MWIFPNCLSHHDLVLTFSVAYQHGTGAADSKGIRPETDMTLGMAERRKTESPPDEESWGGGQWFKSRSDSKSPSLGLWLFLVQSVTIPVEHSSDVKQRPKKIS